MAEANQLKALLDKVKPLHLFIAMGALSLVVMLWVSFTMFEVDGPLPPPRPAPPKIEKSAVTNYRFKKGFFKALVNEDADKLRLPRQEAKRLFAGNPHSVEFTGKQVLRGTAKLETEHLLLQAGRKRTWIGGEGNGIRSSHLVLRITNKTDNYLAYRVETSVRANCADKGALSQNALALKPKESVVRTECQARRRAAITVRRVEVMELSGLGYYYVSRLNPVQIRLSERTSEGHEIPGGLKPCRLLPWRKIQAGMKDSSVSWRDVIDFYSRHSCDEYTFFVGYHYAPNGPERLPVIPPKD